MGAGDFSGVPIVVLFYSYLYCFCVLIGVLTRSTVAAVLVTLLFWLCLFGLHTTEVTLLLFQTHDERAHVNLLAQIDRERAALAEIPASSTTLPSFRQKLLETQLATDLQARDEYHPSYVRVHELFYWTMVGLPKTAETVELLQRKLIRRSEIPGEENRSAEDDEQNDSMNSGQIFSRGDMAAVRKIMRKRTTAWIAGTSLGFEVAVLLLAGWIFCRRDY